MCYGPSAWDPYVMEFFFLYKFLELTTPLLIVSFIGVSVMTQNILEDKAIV